MFLKHDLFRGPADFKRVSPKPQEDVLMHIFLSRWNSSRHCVKAFLISLLLHSPQVCVPDCCSAGVLLSSWLQQVAALSVSWSLGSTLSSQALYSVVFHGNSASQQSCCELPGLMVLPTSSIRNPRLLQILKPVNSPCLTHFSLGQWQQRYILEKNVNQWVFALFSTRSIMIGFRETSKLHVFFTVIFPSCLLCSLWAEVEF